MKSDLAAHSGTCPDRRAWEEMWELTLWRPNGTVTDSHVKIMRLVDFFFF